jgi:ribonuclease Z
VRENLRLPQPWSFYIPPMSLIVRFLGTSASRPTVERNVTSLVVIREGETLMFDCGEGTQRQMMRYGTSFALRDIFFTHMHADHTLGVIGLFRTLALQGREEPMTLWGPTGSESMLRRAIAIGSEKETFPVEYREVTPDSPVKRKDYSIVPFPVDHGGGRDAIGYSIVEDTRLGRFNPDLARELGIPEGPMWGMLHRGQTVTLANGNVIDPASLVGPTRPGRRVVFTGDARPCAASIEASRGADLLIHEATFGDDELQRALDTGHSTAREAAGVAAEAEVKQLALTHLSARYSMSAADLLREAKEVFANTVVARDGMEIDIPFADADQAEE